MEIFTLFIKTTISKTIFTVESYEVYRQIKEYLKEKSNLFIKFIMYCILRMLFIKSEN